MELVVESRFHVAACDCIFIVKGKDKQKDVVHLFCMCQKPMMETAATLMCATPGAKDKCPLQLSRRALTFFLEHNYFQTTPSTRIINNVPVEGLAVRLLIPMCKLCAISSLDSSGKSFTSYQPVSLNTFLSENQSKFASYKSPFWRCKCDTKEGGNKMGSIINVQEGTKLEGCFNLETVSATRNGTVAIAPTIAATASSFNPSKFFV